MMYKTFLLKLLVCLLFLGNSALCFSQQKDLAHWVNPFIGASTNTEAAGAYHGLGKTYPGATTPFGMVQVSPQTITGGDNASGYSDEHKTIEGFALTQMSGVGWYGDMGNFMVMPTLGKLYTSSGIEKKTMSGWRSHYDKKTETAYAGYYSVFLTDYAIRAETTATTHCGAMRFTFPKSDSAHVQIDLARRVGGTSSLQYIKVVDNHTLEGWMVCTPEGGGWGNGDGHVSYTVFFHAELNKPMSGFGFWSADVPKSVKGNDLSSSNYQQMISHASIIKGSLQGTRGLKGRHIGFYADYKMDEGESLELTVGISYVDLDGARKNYTAEASGRTFEQIRMAAVQEWNKSLGCIEIEGGSDDERSIFYTALYHTMLDPRIFQDVDGRYVSANGRVCQAVGNFTKRTLFSGWDVFRSQMPLQTIIHPQVVNDVLGSMISLAEQSGRKYYERWELFNAYTGCMLGNPLISVLTDAYVKGIRDYDIAKAYEYAKNSSARFGNDSLGYTPGNFGISYTLEYAYTDWCLSQLAEALGKKEDRVAYAQKGLAYRNIFDKEKMWFRPKDAQGQWLPWPEEGILKEWYGCMECNPLQQGWFVPHDVDGMVRLFGGKKKVEEKLDWMFSHTPKNMLWNEYYNHANEPVHFVPYLYNRLGKEWKTQRATRYICKNAYHNSVAGLVGNDDAGQVSAWYVLSALGIHQYCPGQTRFEVTSPLFEKATIHLPQGKTFTIIAHGNSQENIYIQHATLNGKSMPLHLDYRDIMSGGVLYLKMGNVHK